MEIWIFTRLGKKGLLECSLCHRQLHYGIKWLKQHLVCGFGDIGKCLKATLEIRNEILQILQEKFKNKANIAINLEDDDEIDTRDLTQRQPSSQDSSIHPSSGTINKRKHSKGILKFNEL